MLGPAVRPHAPGVLAAVVALAGMAGGTGDAGAHVQPNRDTNNRYLKLTLMGDRVRVAYTVYLGEEPGRRMRRHLDRNRDGVIGDDESEPYGRQVAATVEPALHVVVDGRPVQVTWTAIDVGLGTPEVSAGALAVDMVGWLCVGGEGGGGGGGGAHRILVRDTLVIDLPGDSELKIEDGPGIHVGDRVLDGKPMDGMDATWTGRDGPLAGGGLELSWRADADAVRPRDGVCDAGGGGRGGRAGWWLGAGVGAVTLVGVAVLLVRRRRRAS